VIEVEVLQILLLQSHTDRLQQVEDYIRGLYYFYFNHTLTAFNELKIISENLIEVEVLQSSDIIFSLLKVVSM
jgi:hypothetical protein